LANYKKLLDSDGFICYRLVHYALPKIKGQETMNIQTVLADLKKERMRLDAAIEALEGLGSGSKRGPGRPAGSGKARGAPKGRHMSAAARKRISEMMKKRWAERKKGTKG